MSSSQEILLERKLKYSGPGFAVYSYRIQLGDKVIVRDIIERKHGVVAVPVDREGNVILLSEYCAGSNSFILSLPGGKAESTDADSLEQEAQRELREETGYRARRMVKLRFAWSHPSTSNRRSHVFLAFDLVRDPLPESQDEIIRIVRLPLESAIERVYEDFVSDVSTIGNLLMARDKLFELGWLNE